MYRLLLSVTESEGQVRGDDHERGWRVLHHLQGDTPQRQAQEGGTLRQQGGGENTHNNREGVPHLSPWLGDPHLPLVHLAEGSLQDCLEERFIWRLPSCQSYRSPLFRLVAFNNVTPSLYVYRIFIFCRHWRIWNNWRTRTIVGGIQTTTENTEWLK